MEQSQITDVASDVVNNVLKQDGSIDVVSHAAAVPVHDSSMFSMFWNAGFIIKLVMLSLLVASVWSWAIIISKYFRLKKLSFDANYFEESFWSGTPLSTLYDEVKESLFDPMTNVFCAAMMEWERFLNKNNVKAGSLALERRADKAMRIAIQKESDELEKQMVFLSTLGTNGVIIGLFGTVLGILNGFKAIAIQQSTSIATVAPVISEALLTTALGIIAAIPAAVGYNKIMSDINRYVSRLETFADEFGSILSRQLDE
ncbi:MAG: protein TolQ [Holosporales bacterium]|jgi:biopolymer transport protein TolQ|nr:protein TolQ [Holosporales bacterium]